MNAGRTIVLWLASLFACFLPASAQTPSAPENRVWEIFSIGYDAPTAEATDLGSRTETSTSYYDTAPIHRANTEKIATEPNRTLVGQNAEFKAAEATGDYYSVAYQTELKASSYPGVSRGAHFQEANENLLSAMESDPQFAQMMNDMGVNLERTPTGLAPRQSPAGWTWHHADDPGVMQLVPRAQHAPGSIFQDTLHPGGEGGYSLWGQ